MTPEPEQLTVTSLRKNRMPQNFSLYEVYGIAGGADDEQFDAALLPFELVEGLRIENVAALLRADTFEFVKERMGTDAVRQLSDVTYALVHRHTPKPAIVDGEWIGEEVHNQASADLVRQCAACLRLIRPMRQSAQLIWGGVRQDGSFDVLGFDSPVESHEVPEAQKYFHLRNSDAKALKTYLPEFLRSMRGQFWKFRMAVQFHELGHFQHLAFKARYILWASAIESIYTSHNWEHQGSAVAKERIKWFLGTNTSIYAPGDIPKLLVEPSIAVGDIVDRLYEVRNFIAHGDKIPDHFFQDHLRASFNGHVNVIEVLLEASSFIIRDSLIKILREGLLEQFADAASAESYFGAAGLTRSQIKKRPAASSSA
jgi:hypothetical protein